MSLAIIAGSGDLPKMIIKECQETNRKFLLILIKGESSNQNYSKYDHHIIHIGYVGKALKILRENKITDIVFAGGINKPSVANIKVDGKGALLLSKITGAKLFGDDTVLTAITNFLKKEGFNIIGADKIIKNLFIGKGSLGKIKLKKEFLPDIDIGKDAIKAISGFDIGQSVIVQQKQIIGIEAKEGTDALITRCASLKFKNGRKPILVKMKKLGQNTTVDLPSLGVETIRNLHKCDFAGIATQAGASLIINKVEVIKLANQYDLFLVGF